MRRGSKTAMRFLNCAGNITFKDFSSKPKDQTVFLREFKAACKHAKKAKKKGVSELVSWKVKRREGFVLSGNASTQLCA